MSLPRAYREDGIVALYNFYLPGMEGVGPLMVDCGSTRVRPGWQKNRDPQAVREVLVFVLFLAAGAPSYLRMDAAKELHSETLYTGLKQLSVRPRAIASMAQWGNPAERYIKVFKEFVVRFRIAHKGTAPKIVLMACEFAVNSVITHDAFNALHRDQGYSPSLPGLLTSSETALTITPDELASVSPLVFNAMKLMVEGQMALTLMLSDSKIQRTLSMNKRPTGGPFSLGQEVVVWQKGKGFSEEGRVCGKFGPDVVILRGNRLMHAHDMHVAPKFPEATWADVPGDDFEKASKVLQTPGQERSSDGA